MKKLDDLAVRPTVSLWPIVMLRVYTGCFFLYFGVGKIARDNFGDGMTGFVTANLENAVGVMRPFLESVVLPNSGFFAFLVSWGEVAIGIALVLGLATRWASVAGALMVAAFWATKGQGILDAQNHDAIWFFIFIALAGLHAGRVMGLDERLAGRFRFLA